MRLNTLKPAPGSRHRRKIVGRGEGSGHGGKGSTRGFKGQTARSGDSHMRHGFEGGQIPLIRRIPKRGFKTTAFRTVYSLVNVGDIEAVIATAGEVTPDTLRAAGLVKGSHPIKVLGDGDVVKAYGVKAHAFSASAKTKLEKAGGRAELIAGPAVWKRKKA
ncbi:MAG: 50S ribosomal protein L15 [Elusimicrobia bacterium]|nr:50S ribosomal protein L15 [Elusimicrobiota bacterium]MBP9127472.1 50S ribosomal protein L15 [Elusimicrobiota bacterium]MBP9698564.1 50S ribosomal protein L15 [Elusimicrobiota bacterium]